MSHTLHGSHQTFSPPLMSSSSPSSLMTSHGVALATAVAVSGTMILLALRRQKPFSASASPGDAVPHRNSTSPWCQPRSCMASSEDKKRDRSKRKKKKVHFATEVEEFEAGRGNEAAAPAEVEGRPPARRMPANRAALYNGILRDRGMQRVSYCY